MGVSEMLLCPYRSLEDIMVNSKSLKFYSASATHSPDLTVTNMVQVWAKLLLKVSKVKNSRTV